MQSVFWGRELQAIGQDLDTQRLPPQLEKGGVEGRPQHPNSPQHGLQGPHIIHHIAVNCSLKEDGAVLVDMSLFAKPTITCNMEFSLFPFDVQRCQVKIQVRKLRGKSPGKASKPFSHYDDVSGVAVKGQTGPEDPPRFELQSWF